MRAWATASVGFRGFPNQRGSGSLTFLLHVKGTRREDKRRSESFAAEKPRGKETAVSDDVNRRHEEAWSGKGLAASEHFTAAGRSRNWTQLSNEGSVQVCKHMLAAASILLPCLEVSTSLARSQGPSCMRVVRLKGKTWQTNLRDLVASQTGRRTCEPPSRLSRHTGPSCKIRGEARALKRGPTPTQHLEVASLSATRP